MTTAPHLPTSCRTDDELGAGRHVNAGLQKINYWRTQRANKPGLGWTVSKGYVIGARVCCHPLGKIAKGPCL